MTKPTFDMDAAMQGELEAHLASEDTANRKNGSSHKTITSQTRKVLTTGSVYSRTSITGASKIS